MRKILFLDVDGVLNSRNSFQQDSANPLGEFHLSLLKRIVDETNCDIVLSSSWRMYKDSKADLLSAFERHGIPKWIGQTPDLCDERRVEIVEWLTKNINEQCIVVIVDDDDDADLIETRYVLEESINWTFVQTTFEEGLNEVACQKIIEGFKL